MAQHVHKERSLDAFLSSAPLLPELVEHIDVGTKWYLLGTLLYVDDKRLDGIEQFQGHDDTSKTLKMFQHWLTTTPTASRRQVLEALRKSVISQHTVADKYEKYLKELHDTTYTLLSTEAVSILERNTQSLNEALISPVQVSQLLYCKRCISEATLNEMERIDQGRSLDDKKTTLLTTIKKTVFNDFRKLKDIATVLSDVEQTKDIANEIMTKYEETISQEDDSTVVQPQEAVGGNEDCASDILRNNYSALSQSITEPVRMARLLHEEVISDEDLSCIMSTRGSVSASRAVLLKAVRDAVHSNYKHLESFVTVLRKFSETAYIGDTVFEEYRKRFNYGNIEEDKIYVVDQKSMSTTSESSSLDDDTHGDHKILFPRDMKNKFEDMRMKFGSTFFKVRRIFTRMKSVLNIDEVKELISDWFSDLRSELSYTGTIEEVLNVLKRKCSIVDLRPLENLAFEFNIEEAEPIIKSFKEEAKDFCKSVSVSLCLGEKLQAVATPSRLLCETVVFVFNWDPDECTLQNIKDVLDELEPLNKYHIQIDEIGTGRSVVVTCYCPAEYTGSLIIAVLDKTQILQKRGLKEFVVGNCTIWSATQVVSENRDVKEFLVQINDLKTALKDRDEKIMASETELSTLKELLEALKINLENSQCINVQMEEEINELKEKMSSLKEEYFDTEEELALFKELSENRLREIKQLKLELEENNYSMYASTSDVSTDESLDSDTSMQEAGEVVWSQKCVHFINSSVDQCIEVVNKLEDKHEILTFSKSSSENIQFLIPIMLKQGTIKKLVIQSSLLTPDDILSFSSQLSTNKSLTILNLTRGSMRDDGVTALTQSLQHNKTLESLDLSYNPGITSASALSLAKLLLTNNTLTDLDLSHSSIDTDGVMILMGSCKTDNTFKKFRLVVGNITNSLL